MLSLIGRIGFFSILVTFILIIFYIICFAKILKKTGRRGYISLVPVYNFWTFFEISNLRGWFSLVPVANVFMIFVALYKLSILFGKSILFGIFCALFPFICIPVLAYGKSSYKGYIEEYKRNAYNQKEPVYSSDDKVYNVIKDEYEAEYKSVNNIKIDKHSDKNINLDNTLIDYSLRLVTNELPDPVFNEKKESKFIKNNDEDDIEIIDL